MTIEINAMQFAYADAPNDLIINIANWRVNKGEQVFIHGPSGSGKSTFLKLLSGMQRPTQGSLNILGTDITRMSQAQRDQFRAQHVGQIFQQFNLIPYLNALENIELAQYFCKRKQANKRAAMEDLLTALNIAQSDWRKTTDKLSLGQQQRVAIARALVNRPQLIIADEPTSSLDQHNADNFMQLLFSLAKEVEATLLFASHDMSLADRFSRVEALADFNHQTELS
ncbi:ABC transporter ATP-binding protein [Saccharobesus litoralis]|uniref:ABC transporter ATP-binding protein n=1 Tax=Saccharobesus litoralis TaxID=2172099 RepID=A0A2S0VN21_9ALTE|nr:ABC transporter ATP-binding protein [Saccharobesus litoralis]AWB65572.1 ABC transporter ATP-binding protein [Saccharobesus litoralis]